MGIDYKVVVGYRYRDELRFYVPFSSISNISGRYVGQNERLCAMYPRSRLVRFSDLRPLDQQASAYRGAASYCREAAIKCLSERQHGALLPKSDDEDLNVV